MLYALKAYLANYVMIPLVFSLGFYFSYKLRWIQITKIFRACKLFIKDHKLTGNCSSFSALAAVLGGNLGTGNIAGMAVALSMGGPGAIFWMWVMAILGSILKFTGCVLGVLYRIKDTNNELVGGPMYYITNGLGLKKTGKLYCIFTILAAITVGNFVQMHSVALPLIEIGISPLAIGTGMAILVAAVIFGGLHRFSLIVSQVVPFMAISYFLACVVILSLNYQNIIPAINLIITSAFNPSSAIGGVAGFGIFQAIRAGFDRGLFATDCGVGIAPIIHSSVDTPCEHKTQAFNQGIISTLSPIIVMLICTLTGLVLIVTNAWQNTSLESTNLCIEAFRVGLGHHLAGHIVTVTLFFFAFTTILTWSFCADKAIEYLFCAKLIKYFQWIFILLLPIGVYFNVNQVWTLADLFMNIMLLINVIGLVGLFGQVKKLITEF